MFTSRENSGSGTRARPRADCAQRCSWSNFPTHVAFMSATGYLLFLSLGSWWVVPATFIHASCTCSRRTTNATQYAVQVDGLNRTVAFVTGHLLYYHGSFAISMPNITHTRRSSSAIRRRSRWVKPLAGFSTTHRRFHTSNPYRPLSFGTWSATSTTARSVPYPKVHSAGFDTRHTFSRRSIWHCYWGPFGFRVGQLPFTGLFRALSRNPSSGSFA